jgi:uncharacterized membrane protein YagU involved in acid resistance
MNVTDAPKIALAATAGTLVMSGVAAMAPMMGMPPMNPAAMMAEPMGGSMALGWMAHLMVGNVLGFAFAWVVAARLPGPLALRGALFSVAPWLLAQLMVMPMMGKGLFSGSMTMAAGSLMGHLVYGAVLGGVLSAAHVETAPSAVPA